MWSCEMYDVPFQYCLKSQENLYLYIVKYYANKKNRET